ncbi:hypothetical protein B0H14DRAFT_3466164 [Mycena olivaceomarginata]|nr:hypothetical protein B0H14DRAFT_3466164 [Mycena olivaceomarginata]
MRLILPPVKYVSSGRVDFNAAGLPEYQGCYAIVLDSLFSAEELSSFLAEAETRHTGTATALYDSFELSDKIFARIRPHLEDIEEFQETVFTSGEAKQKWRMVRMNERLRFLRYPIGGYFKDHQDGCYIDESVKFLNSRTLSVAGISTNRKTQQRTFYTVQFYLPSDSSGSEASFVPPQGGSTRFLSWSSKSKHAYADVEAVPCRVLVFQHAKLLHTGEEVTGGVKCTVRSDILYERVGPPVLVD